MDGQSFVAPHDQCASTLQEYVEQAQKTCNMLSEFKDKQPSAAELMAVTVERSRENEVQRKYMEVRERLLEAAQRDYRRG
jgi:hypothetical protein